MTIDTQFNYYQCYVRLRKYFFKFIYLLNVISHLVNPTKIVFGILPNLGTVCVMKFLVC